MIRILLAGLLIAAIVLVAVQVLRQAKNSNVDWTGVAFIAAFVVAAFWLRDLTGLG